MPNLNSDFVSVDGSPLAMYLAIPADHGPTIVHAAVEPRSSILELGSGPGRMTRVLVAYGHAVTAVDDSAEMLAHVTGAERVCADAFALDLGRTFDVVVAASHLINQPDRAQRAALLDVCRRHVAPEGTVLLERYPAGWAAGAADFATSVGPVDLTFEAGRLDGDVRHAAVTYRLAERSWRQEFAAVDVDDIRLAEEAAAAGLTVAGSLDPAATWVRLHPTSA